MRPRAPVPRCLRRPSTAPARAADEDGDHHRALTQLKRPNVTVTVVAAEHSGKEAEATDALRFDDVRLLAYES